MSLCILAHRETTPSTLNMLFCLHLLMGIHGTHIFKVSLCFIFHSTMVVLTIALRSIVSFLKCFLVSLSCHFSWIQNLLSDLFFGMRRLSHTIFFMLWVFVAVCTFFMFDGFLVLTNFCSLSFDTRGLMLHKC